MTIQSIVVWCFFEPKKCKKTSNEIDWYSVGLGMFGAGEQKIETVIEEFKKMDQDIMMMMNEPTKPRKKVT